MSTLSYKFDPMHTSVMWCCSHFGFSSPKGQFTQIDGDLSFNEEIPEQSALNVVIDINTLSTGIDKFNEHLKSKDFFNCEEFPEARFKSTRITMIDNKTAKVEGDFTLLGVTKSLVLNASMNLIGVNPMTNKKSVGFTAKSELKRSDFGMSAYLPGIGDTVKLKIEAEVFVE